MSSSRDRWASVRTGWRYFVTKTKWACSRKTVSTSANVVCLSHGPSRLFGMQLRYRYRLDPTPAQRQALACAFGCARVVYNDGLRLREDAYRAGLPFVGGGGAVPTGRHARQADPATGVARGGLETAVGIDLGLTSFAALSDGRKVDNPRWLRQRERALRRSQRNLRRKRKGSRNREKARLRTARLHARVADARRDFHHQFS